MTTLPSPASTLTFSLYILAFLPVKVAESHIEELLTLQIL